MEDKHKNPGRLLSRLSVLSSLFLIILIAETYFLYKLAKKSEYPKKLISPMVLSSTLLINTPTQIPIISSTPSPAPKVRINTPIPTNKPNGNLESSIPGSESLFRAVNDYRKNLSLPILEKDNTLAQLAQKRANDLQALGRLDNHEGFSKADFSGFVSWGEVLFSSSKPQTTEYIVEIGWAQSTAGHKEILENPAWNCGGGSIAGNFAVFIFASK